MGTFARSGGPLRWLLWSPALAVVFSATVVAGGLLFFLLPLIGVFYGVFAWIGWSGPRGDGDGR
jgi:hypothetical protein